jgi:hypothetical protein
VQRVTYSNAHGSANHGNTHTSSNNSSANRNSHDCRTHRLANCNTIGKPIVTTIVQSFVRTHDAVSHTHSLVVARGSAHRCTHNGNSYGYANDGYSFVSANVCANHSVADVCAEHCDYLVDCS